MRLMPRIKDVESLMLRFPTMFSRVNTKYEFYSGWFPDFVDLCHELEAILGLYDHAFQWVQMKEKFGSYRLHCTFRPPLVCPPRPRSLLQTSLPADPLAVFADTAPQFAPLRQQVRDAINRAAQKINAKCAVCGDSAKPESHGGWWGTLCAYHNIAARQARGDTRDRHELWAVPLTPADVSGARWR